ncbi:MAG: hypothetical protein IPJ85_17465 [Flavobacteriales bacterium]|nr:hypothetical protein [Flavobacteriales bacterium]
MTDNDGLTGQTARTISAISLDAPQCAGAAGGLQRQQWNSIAGATVADLLNAPSYPNNPASTSVITSFQGPTNAANNYGARVRGYIVPPETGNYTFTITSDDASALYLSLNAEPRFKQLICSVPGTTLANEFDKCDPGERAGISWLASTITWKHCTRKPRRMITSLSGGSDHRIKRAWWCPEPLLCNGRIACPESACARSSAAHTSHRRALCATTCVRHRWFR